LRRPVESAGLGIHPINHETRINHGNQTYPARLA
jgi:hypothetical protein